MQVSFYEEEIFSSCVRREVILLPQFFKLGLIFYEVYEWAHYIIQYRVGAFNMRDSVWVRTL